MFPSTLNRNLHKPTSGSKLRKSVTWDDLPPATPKGQTTSSPIPVTHTSTSVPPLSPTPVQRQRHPTKPSEPEEPQEAETEDDTDTPTATSAGSRNYIHAGWSLLRAEQIRKHILALEGQHARGQGAEKGRRDSGFVDVTQEDVVSGEMQVEYPSLPVEEEIGGMSASSGCIGKGKGKQTAMGEAEGEEEGEQSQMEGMRVEYPSLPGVENGF